MVQKLPDSWDKLAKLSRGDLQEFNSVLLPEGEPLSVVHPSPQKKEPRKHRPTSHTMLEFEAYGEWQVARGLPAVTLRLPDSPSPDLRVRRGEQLVCVPRAL